MHRLLLLLLVASASAVRYDGYHILSVGPVSSRADVQAIKSLVDVNYEDRQVMMLKEPGDLMVAPHMVDVVKSYLKAHDLPYLVVETDFQKHHEEVMRTSEANKVRNEQRKAEGLTTGFSYDYYMDFDELIEYVQSLVDASSIATMDTIGDSYEGVPLYMVTVNGGSSLPAVWLDSNIHAREWITAPSNVYILEEILFGTDADSVRMRSDYKWYILPSVNPDGYIFTWSDDRMWRKTRSPNQGSPCVGTDPNRNFGYAWGEPGASENPCADDYMGSEAFSEAETQAIRDAVIPKASELIATVSFHAYGQYWLHPWGHTNDHAPHRDDMRRNGDASVAAIYDVHGRVFELGTPPELLYIGSGGSFDWMYGDQGLTYSFSPEARPATSIEGGFDPDPSHILPSGEELYASIIALVDDIADNGN